MRELLKIAALLSFQEGRRYCRKAAVRRFQTKLETLCVAAFLSFQRLQLLSIAASLRFQRLEIPVNSSISEFPEAANQCWHLGIRSFEKMRIL